MMQYYYTTYAAAQAVKYDTLAQELLAAIEVNLKAYKDA
jgi:hypothetical protein